MYDTYSFMVVNYPNNLIKWTIYMQSCSISPETYSQVNSDENISPVAYQMDCWQVNQFAAILLLLI